MGRPALPASRASSFPVGHAVRRWNWLPALLLAVGLFGDVAPAKAQSSWEFTPYSVQVWLSVDGPSVPTALEEDLRRALIQRAEAVHGAAWVLEVAPPPANLRSKLQSAIESVSIDDLQGVPSDPLSHDKVWLVSIARDEGWFRVRVRECDCRTQQWSTLAEDSAPNADALASTVWQSMNRVFTPLAKIEAVDGRNIVARVRAGGLVTDLDSPLLIRPDAVLKPIVRRNDRSGRPGPEGIQVPEYTLLRVTAVTRSQLTCQLVSGYRAPIPVKAGQRTERLALLVRSEWSQTRLVLMSRTSPTRPLGGYDVYQFESREVEPKLIGTTAIDGSIVLPSTDGRMMSLLVRSGGQLLARLPIVPGQSPEMIAKVVDDDGRLQAEGFVLAFQSRVMDLVARRELAAARFKKQLAAGKIDEAQDTLEEFRLLETRADLTRVLDQQQQAITSRDRITELRIQRLFADARKLLMKFLDPETGNALARELAAARTRAPVATPASAPSVSDGEPLAAPQRP